MHQRTTKPTSDMEPMSIANSSDHAKKGSRSIRVLLALYPLRSAGICLILVAFVALVLQPEAMSNSEPESDSARDSDESAPAATAASWRQYEECTSSWSPPADRAVWTTKPLWFPQHPNSVEDNIVKSLVGHVTGMANGAKTYYASSKSVRRCFGVTETAACLVVHPIVKMSPSPADKKDLYGNKFVFLLRNPLTVIPAHFNFKGISYHGLVGQTPINDWRKVRDEYASTLLGDWKLTLEAWTDMGIERGMYFTFEHLMSPETGPATLQRLTHLLKDAGFPTAPDADIPCLWYQSLGKEALEQYEATGYDYTDYVPGFTGPQKDAFVKELVELQTQYATDAELVAILKEYVTQIEAAPADMEWKNETAA